MLEARAWSVNYIGVDQRLELFVVLSLLYLLFDIVLQVFFRPIIPSVADLLLNCPTLFRRPPLFNLIDTRGFGQYRGRC